MTGTEKHQPAHATEGEYVDAAGTPVPPPPAYGGNSVADVLESAASLTAQGALPHPSHPLNTHPGFVAEPDPLNLAKRLTAAGVDAAGFRNTCVIMVDGLGEQLLTRYGSYAPFLKKTVSLGPLDAAFPTTTAASLTSLGTACPPGAHGIAGYEVRNPATGTTMNHLSGWDKTVEPATWQPLPTVFERYGTNRRVITISQDKYRGSGFTQAALRGSEFVAATGYAARITYAAELLSSRTPTLIYLYWGELDQAGHRHGVGSTEWVEQLEEIDSALRRLAQRVPAWAGIFLTADHGMVNIPQHNRIDYSTDTHLLDNVVLTAGEPRAVHLYLNDAGAAARAETARRWANRWGEQAWVLDTYELYRRGYFGPVINDYARERIGDLMVCARENIALYDMRHYTERALHMVGQHGSLTEDEWHIPLRYLNVP